MLDSKALRNRIREIVKHIWMNEIRQDYDNSLLIGEDTFKNALYYHLRKYLKYEFEVENIRVYTEYYIRDAKAKADLFIGYLNPETIKGFEETREWYNIKEAVEPLAIFELKYKNYFKAHKDFISDFIKVKEKYEKSDELPKCDYYIAHISECNLEKLLFVDKAHKKNFFITELAAMWDNKNEEMIWDFH